MIGADSITFRTRYSSSRQEKNKKKKERALQSPPPQAVHDLYGRVSGLSWPPVFFFFFSFFPVFGRAPLGCIVRGTVYIHAHQFRRLCFFFSFFFLFVPAFLCGCLCGGRRRCKSPDSPVAIACLDRKGFLAA